METAAGQGAGQGAELRALLGYRYLSVCADEKGGLLEVKENLNGSSVLICAMAVSDYAALTGAQAPALEKGQALAYSGGAGLQRDLTFTFPTGDLSLNVLPPSADAPAPVQFCPSAVDVWYLVVSEEDLSALYSGQSAALGDGAELMVWRAFWNVSAAAAQSVDFPRQVEEAADFSGTGTWVRLDLESRTSFGDSYYSLNGGFFFLGIFLGSIFIMATVLIIYYKQISEGYEDRERYLIMQKVGMERTTVRQSVNVQLLTVFFAPLLVSAVHVAFDFGLMTRLLTLFSLHNTALTLLCTLGTLGAFALIYALVYFATAKTYYKLVSA